jgi:hypothetical protein
VTSERLLKRCELTPTTYVNVKVTFGQDTAQTKTEPDHPRKDCEESDDGDEVSRDKIGHPFNWRAAGLTLTDDLNNLIEPECERSGQDNMVLDRTGFSHILSIKTGDPNVDGAALIDRSKKNLVSWSLLDRF